MKAKQFHSVYIFVFAFKIFSGSGQIDEKRFSCGGQISVGIHAFCDGRKDCPGGEDEKIPQTSQPTSEWQSCVNSNNTYNGSCSIRRKLICNEDVLCSNVNPCDVHCNNTHYKCQGLNKCVRRDSVCNENPCDGCPGTNDWRNGAGFKCLRHGKECVLPQQLVLDDFSDCDGEIDSCFGIVAGPNGNERVFLRNKCFRCLNDEMIIPKQRICDGIIDCSDLSDECLCEGNKTEICDQVIQYDNAALVLSNITATYVDDRSHVGGCGEAPLSRIDCEVGAVLCTNRYCIPRSSICDGVKDCENDEGSEYCRGTVSCRNATRPGVICRCQNSLVGCKTSYGRTCDGKQDCSVTSSYSQDECLASCFNTSVLPPTCADGWPIIQPHAVWHLCRPALTNGTNNNSTSANTTTKPLVTFPNMVPPSSICNGIAECRFGDDEENCPLRFKCDAVQVGYVSVRLEKVCDGVKDCTSEEDEEDERCNKTRFRCEVFDNRLSIDVSLVRDGMINCNDGKDELNCTEDGRFYCEGGDPLFVTKRQKFDGRGDCADWSDECPIKNPVQTDLFSSRYQMIGKSSLRVVVWIMALLSLSGNGVVICLITKQLKSLKKSSSVAIANKMLILNLAVADVLMGIYLFGLAIAGVVMQGRYCSLDLQWRSSSSCIALGVIVVLSSEASVMTILLLTGCRLYAVYKPFKSSSHPRKRVVALMILLAWSAALSIALIPFGRYLSGTFVASVEFKDNALIRNVPTSLEEARRSFKGLMTYDLKPNMTLPVGFSADKLSLHDIEEWGAKIFVHQHFAIERVFGYYSTDSVCLPKFFAVKSDRSWRFSFFVNLLNFVAFIFVATCYIAIYIRTRGNREIRSSAHTAGGKNSSDIQGKIIRLIVTDFCCWIPICIMSFVKLGGIYLSNSAYVFAAIILLPLNSALNPFLYSNLPDVLYYEAKKLLSNITRKKTSKPEQSSSGHIHKSHTTAL